MMSNWATFKIGPSLFGCEIEILNKLRIVQWETPLCDPQIATIMRFWLFIIVSWQFEDSF